jgi:S1-C subfamily serine protease
VGIPLLLICLLGSVAGVYFYFKVEKRATNNPNAQERAVTPRGERNDIEKERIAVFKNSSPGVVNVDTLRLQRSGFEGVSERQQGTGSGFVWDEEGRIVTNFHVIRDALAVNRAGDISINSGANIRVTMADRTAWNARLVGVAPDKDLAVLQIDAKKDQLKPLPVGTSSDLDVGQTVYAIGNPFGLSLTFSQGIVSALDREIQSVTDRPITGVIQTDASLNPGNSGGPLLDREGRLIGVNTAITSPSGGSVGIGYAIPIDTVNRVVTDLIKTGRTARPVLGIVIFPERDARANGIDEGVVVSEVRPNSPAAKAGILGFKLDPRTNRQTLGDVIVMLDNQPIKSQSDLEKFMQNCRIQQTIKVTVQRGQQRITMNVTLEGI